MSYFSKLSAASELVSGMMTRLDVPMADALQTSPEAVGPSYRSMVFACAGCKHQGACARLQEDNLLLEKAPDYCVNRKAFGSS